MPRPRKAVKACQTDYDLFERRLSALEEEVPKLKKENADFESQEFPAGKKP